ALATPGSRGRRPLPPHGPTGCTTAAARSRCRGRSLRGARRAPDSHPPRSTSTEPFDVHRTAPSAESQRSAAKRGADERGFPAEEPDHLAVRMDVAARPEEDSDRRGTDPPEGELLVGQPPVV